jgi:hypothetical protein
MKSKVNYQNISAIFDKYRVQFLIVGIFAISLAFYIYTLCPSIGWEDAPKFPKEAYLLKVSALPWSHPLYIVIGHLFTKIPVGDIAYRMNLVSAVFGSLTLVAVFVLLRLLFSLEKGVSENKKLLAALGAILSLMVSRTFWLHSVTAEVYIVLSFFVVAIIYCLVRFDIKGDTRFLYLGLFLYGLSVSVHIMTVCALPGIVAYLIMMAIKYKKGILNVKSIAIAAICFLAGFSLYLGFAVKDSLYLRNTFDYSVWDILNIMVGRTEEGGRFLLPFFQSDHPLWYSPLQAIGFHFYDFMVLGTLLGLFGLVMFLVKNMRSFCYIFIIYAGFLFYAISFYVADQNTFYLPALTIFSIFIGYGLLKLLKLMKSKLKLSLVAATLLPLLVVAPVFVYHSLPTWIASLDWEGRSTWEERVVFNYGRRGEWELAAVWQQEGGKELLVKHYLNPNQRGDFIPREYGESILDSLPANSVFLTGDILDWYAMAVIDYLKVVENKRPDVEHIHWEFPDEWFTYEEMLWDLRTNAAERPVFVSTEFYYELGGYLWPWFTFEPYGLVYQVKSK